MSTTTAAHPGTLTIRLDRLFVPENVRDIDEEFIAQLQRSVEARGKIIDPVEVIDADPDIHGEEYDHVLVAGFHRTEVARRLGHDTIPGVHGDAPQEHTDRAVENMVRKQLDPHEQAIAIKRILDEGKSEDQAAQLLGMTKHLITRRVKLLELPDTAQRLIGDGTLALGTVEPMRAIAQASPELLDAAIEYIAEHTEEIAPDDLVYQPLSIVAEAAARSEQDVFIGSLREVPLHDPDLVPQDESTTALLAEAKELHKQVHHWGEPHIRFTGAETDRARAAGVLVEWGDEDPLVTDLTVYQDLCRTAIAAGVHELKQQAGELVESEDRTTATNTTSDKHDDKRATLETAYRRQMRQLAATAHGANLDLGDSLRNGLTVVDPADMTVARFFVYALLGPDNGNAWAGDTVVSAIALRGIRLVIGDFREDKTKTRKDGSAGALRLGYGDGMRHENQSHWLWKYLDGARTAGELYGRALVVIAAEQYASRLVVPASQQVQPLGWPSHKDIALKALTKLARPHIAQTLKALEKAIAKAEREHQEALKALLDAKFQGKASPVRADAEDDLHDECSRSDLDSLDSDPGLGSDEHAVQIDTDTSAVTDAVDLVDQTNAAGPEDVLDAFAEIDF